MSGGTDSSVAALLLLEQGYEVIGITFRFWEEGENMHLNDAIQVAQKLGIQHFVYDARILFKEKIISYFVQEYISGRTPFPCVKCNNELKWKIILEQATVLGCSKVAMGHYVRIKKDNEFLFITQGIDPDKDQSFFLWGLKQEQLDKIIFPLGNYYKSEVRKLAATRGFLRISEKKDSLGACFCAGDYRPFLKSQLANPEKSIYPGNFIDTEGKIIGKHNGFPLYTVGQRRGLVYLNKKIYVKQILPETNEVVLAPHESLFSSNFLINEVNIVDKNLFTDNFDIYTRIRYRKQNTLSRVIFLENNSARVELAEPLDAIAPGQTAVFYRDGRVLGGGFII